MADSLLLPVCLDRLTDSNGVPSGGAKVYVYDAGTTDEKNVYTDAGLETPADNPIVADGAGYVAARYIGTGSYKLVFKKANGSTLRDDEDDLPGALDTSPFSSDKAIPISPVLVKTDDYTVVAGDQGKTILGNCTGGDINFTLPSAVTVGDNWLVTIKHIGTANACILSATGGQTIDGATSFTLNYQYEAVTLVSDGANWHISESGRLHEPALTITPQGRLTLTTGTPVLSSGVSSATSVYYTPYTGQIIPIYNGARFVPIRFSELTLTLVSQHEANGIYDVFGFLDGSTLRIGTGPKWSTVTAGSGARGTGAGTTELERIAGLWTNAEDITLRNGTSTYSVSANRATFLGSIFIDGSAGQVTCHMAFGQSRKWGVWNAYNRRRIMLLAGDSTASWNYSTDTYRPANNSTANSLTVFMGLAEEIATVEFYATVLNSGSSNQARIGIGWNSTTTTSGRQGYLPTGAEADSATIPAARYIPNPFLGINVATMLERVESAGTTTWFGSSNDHGLTAEWWG